MPEIGYTSTHAYLKHQMVIGKTEGKVHPMASHECPEGEQRCSSTFSLTSALDGMGG
jgi:hypothetical protein